LIDRGRARLIVDLGLKAAEPNFDVGAERREARVDVRA
jgi:hypothetical protein